jgi:hypothetical protein
VRVWWGGQGRERKTDAKQRGVSVYPHLPPARHLYILQASHYHHHNRSTYKKTNKKGLMSLSPDSLKDMPKTQD